MPASARVRPFFGLSGPSRTSATQTTGCWIFLFLLAGLGPPSSRRVALPNRAFSSFTFPIRSSTTETLQIHHQTSPRSGSPRDPPSHSQVQAPYHKAQLLSPRANAFGRRAYPPPGAVFPVVTHRSIRTNRGLARQVDVVAAIVRIGSTRYGGAPRRALDRIRLAHDGLDLSSQGERERDRTLEIAAHVELSDQ